MGTDYEKPKLDAESMPIPYPEGKRTRTCQRCGQQWWIEEMVMLSEERYYCHLCYDPPYGEDQHRRGDIAE
jgi:hypothetical protein